MSGRSDAVEVRRAGPADRPAILALAHGASGWAPDRTNEAFFAWKHLDNPVGPSPTWVAEVRGRVAGFQTFLRWEFARRRGALGVRAVDTATHPDWAAGSSHPHPGCPAELRSEGVDFVFNTPNDQSRPGYLKMGWREMGRLPVDVPPDPPRAALRPRSRARTPATRRVPTEAGEDATTVLANATPPQALLADTRRRAGLATRRSPEYLRWRYGLPALHYRVVRGPRALPRASTSGGGDRRLRP